MWGCLCPLQILNTESLNQDYSAMGTTLGEVILGANGFAEVYPEHKFQSACPGCWPGDGQATVFRL
jgi:hypothetical protein